ncbi:translation initiation factor IF-2 [Uranotaenia lowii]|uniref:translation initiation factor IF-2 n=1 Tax=Uranotaenia lowii TaxID=190385 RepID=UPI002479D3C3|nr:translation initiation factor IF-2 [Uranotaenia lowii]
MKKALLLIPFAGLVTLAAAQYGPPPPRINIPGAIPIPVVRGVPIREERVLPPQPQVLRVRRPGPSPNPRPLIPHNAIPVSTPKFFEPEAKPVTEEHEERENSQPFLPVFQSSPAPTQHSIPADLDEREIQQNILSRFNSQDNRPAAVPRAQIPERFFSTDKDISSPAQRFAVNAPERPAAPSPSPQPKQYRPAVSQVISRPQQPIRQQHQYDDERPIHRPQSQHERDEDRRRKPVAQILRKWREEHDDGSITWGFENDDGSFKEETIGIDCVTRGRYGYVDPDGEKREYNYETGIQCDPNKRDEEDEEELEEELSHKNAGKLKRPQQGQQQQYYRN